jgi:hypothetical protein
MSMRSSDQQQNKKRYHPPVRAKWYARENVKSINFIHEQILEVKL